MAVLDHGYLPFLKNPVYLRLVKTIPLARNYAAAGFHVCVTRGLAGGCRDLALDVKGTDVNAACKVPLGRPELATLWDKAASQYLSAYAASTVQGAVLALDKANQAADVAYGKEGVDPPRDPVTQRSEAPLAYKASFPWWTIPAAVGGWWLFGGLFGKKGKKGRKGSRRVRRSRRRR